MLLPTSSVLVDRVLAKTAANAINAIQIKSHSARNIVIEAENYQAQTQWKRTGVISIHIVVAMKT